MASSTIHKTRLLDSYYRKMALSSLPNGYPPYFQLGDMDWGYGLIDESGGDEVLEDIPADLSAIDSVFATMRPTYTYIGGKTIITATLPKSAIPDGESRKWSTCILKDNDGEYVGVLLIEPQSITNKMDISVTLELDTVDTVTELNLA